MVTILLDHWTRCIKHCPNPTLDLVKTSWPILQTPASARNCLHSQGCELITTPDGFPIKDDCSI